MNKKIILSVSAIALVTSSLLAFDRGPNMDFDRYKQYKERDMQDHRPNKRDDDILRIFRELDLTKNQRESIREIMKKSCEDRVHPSDAFTDTSFDKQKYIKLSQRKKEMRIQKKAELIEKIYNLLSDSQKKDLKTILDMQKIKKRNMRHP